MKILYVEQDQGIREVVTIIEKSENIAFDTRYLPQERHSQASLGFRSPDELVRLLQDYDGAVLDRETFGRDLMQGGPGCLLEPYLQTLVASGNQKPLVVTTSQNPLIAKKEVAEIAPSINIFQKPLDYPGFQNLVKVLRGER